MKISSSKTIHKQMLNTRKTKNSPTYKNNARNTGRRHK